MRRVSRPELLDADDCPAEEVAASLRDLSRINRWFGGVATTRKLIERVAAETGKKHFSLLEVASGFGEVPKVAGQQLLRQGITLDVTLLDRLSTHLLRGNRSLVADALALPFADEAFDLVSCNLFAHHLEPCDLARFVHEALRVSRCAAADQRSDSPSAASGAGICGFSADAELCFPRGWSGFGEESVCSGGDAEDDLQR